MAKKAANGGSKRTAEKIQADIAELERQKRLLPNPEASEYKKLVADIKAMHEELKAVESE